MIGFHCFFGGFLPFSAISVELYYIFATVWGREQYTLYGVLLLVFFIVLLVSACISVALTYFQVKNNCPSNFPLINSAFIWRLPVVVAKCIFCWVNRHICIYLLMLLLLETFKYVWIGRNGTLYNHFLYSYKII